MTLARVAMADPGRWTFVLSVLRRDAPSWVGNDGGDDDESSFCFPLFGSSADASVVSMSSFDDSVRDDERGINDAVAGLAHRSTWRSRGPKRRFAVLGIVLVTIFVVVALVQGFVSSQSNTPSVLVGRTDKLAPTFTLPSLSGASREVSLSAFRGKPLVLNFWASWCVPCRTDMPLLERTYRAEKGRVQFLGIDSNDTPSAGLAFYDHVHVNYPALSDPKGTIATRYGLFGLPTTVFISSSGRIIGRFIGQLHASTLLAALKEAFHE